MSIVWRIVSECWSSWRSTISHSTPSPTPRSAITSAVRALTAAMYALASAEPSASISPRTARGVSNASYSVASSGRSSSSPP